MFRKYDQKQQFLLPLSLEDFVPENHLSRVLNDIVDVVDINAIESTYSNEGCPAYHPRPLVKAGEQFLILAGLKFPNFQSLRKARGS